MKIFTSYFGNIRHLKKEGITPVNIAIVTPAWYKGAECKILAPRLNMLNLPPERYLPLYMGILSKLNAAEIIYGLEKMADGRDIALICYEKDGFCHRHLVAQWIQDETRIRVEEYRPMVVKKNIVVTQQSLF